MTQSPDALEFKIDGDQLYAPRESMTAAELIDIALAQKVLDPVEEGYSLEDGKGNSFATRCCHRPRQDQRILCNRKRPGPCLS